MSKRRKGLIKNRYLRRVEAKKPITMASDSENDVER
jgi:hypothetical protein